MKIEIYQIDSEVDDQRMRFCAYDPVKFPAIVYERVYSGDVPCKTLEDVYRKFNLDLPDDYRGQPLSVSDVVHICNDCGDCRAGYYFCDSIGFKEVKFSDKNRGLLDPKRYVVFSTYSFAPPSETFVFDRLEDARSFLEKEYCGELENDRLNGWETDAKIDNDREYAILRQRGKNGINVTEFWVRRLRNG